MTQPAQYNLRDPLFISTRLIPAITVAGATIHMQADTIADDTSDPRVSWHYIIDGPDLQYEARDVTTPYLGPSTVVDQLPTAMGTLLTYLAHTAGGDNRDTDEPLPDTVYQWARRHRDEITLMAELVEHGPQQHMSAKVVWRALAHDPCLTEYGRWCAGQAIAHADRLATLNPSAATTGLVMRDEQWHETALAWYTQLTDQPEPEPATRSMCVVADRNTIEAWLTGPAPHPHTGTMAELLHLVDPESDRPRLRDLVEHAQLAGLFGVTQHTVELHDVLDEADGPIRHLLTIHTPTGTSFAAGPVTTDQLIERRDGPDAAISALRQCATYVDSALATHAGAIDAAMAGRARPFLTVATAPAVTASTRAVQSAPSTRSHHHR